jgi:hypothetical protein
MTIVMRILCLANSRKLSGRCVAGKEVDGGAWIRPVSGRDNEEVSERERRYADGRDPTVLDVIDIPLIRPVPHAHQPENWLLDGDLYWELVETLDWDDMERFRDEPVTLWSNDSSTLQGRNDRVARNALPEDGSLFFIHVDDLKLHVFAPGEAFGNPKRRVHGGFTYGESEYRLWVTDPRVEDGYVAKPDGEYRLGEAYLTISLGEAHNDGYCYKMIAAVVLPHDV